MIRPAVVDTLDVVIVGAGPAGCTAAALLAEKGRRVALLEKDEFPRYHIGESLLPYCWFTLNRLGVTEKMDQIGSVHKYSVQFVSPRGNVSQPFYFFQHFDHPASKTWQVVRSDFDRMLRDHAKEKGVHVFHGITAEKLITENEKVVGVAGKDREGSARQFFGRMTIDCTGRDSLAIKQFNWRVNDPELRKISIWTYYRGAKRDTGYDEGATTVAYIPEKGWFWFIPLPNHVTSVGVVAEKGYLFRETKDPAAIMDAEIQKNPWLVEHLGGAEQFGEYWVTGEYSYRSKHCSADGLLLAGDAFGFLDPVFSSGVFLALKSGEAAADAIHEALDADDVSAERFASYGENLCSGIEAMRKLVYAFYNEDFRFGDLLMKYPDLRPALTDCLIGNLDRDFEPLFTAVAEFAELPQPLPHGRPLVHTS